MRLSLISSTLDNKLIQHNEGKCDSVTIKYAKFKKFDCMQHLHQTQDTSMPIDHITCTLI